jgi:hypothetical protein
MRGSAALRGCETRSASGPDRSSARLPRLLVALVLAGFADRGGPTAVREVQGGGVLALATFLIAKCAEPRPIPSG